MTKPPACSTAAVKRLVADPLAGTSNRTVIEYETLGCVAIAVSPYLETDYVDGRDDGPTEAPTRVTTRVPSLGAVPVG
ncbi:uncharacterized protein PD653_1160 [Nocardioides sp. PD653]|nr:uncharacterized protein PD653B2_0251 [Nocardioides sp. PD653-B2]GAW53757.1 uncharacterized protein PD653_1160 [Nocardioides sp. PD653]